MSQQNELPGMPEAASPRRGSAAWYRSEWRRFTELSRLHHGLTTPAFAAVILGVSRQRVHQLLETGALARYETMGKVWLAVDEVEWFSNLSRGSGFRYNGDTVITA